MNQAIIEVKDLALEFQTRSGTVKALEHINLSIMSGETIGLVGESGSGKSVLSYALIGLLEETGRISHGSILVDGQDLVQLEKKAATKARKTMAMIFQNPRAALNPIRTVGKQIMDVLMRFADKPKRQLKQDALKLMQDVHIPESRFNAYPFELSGGMCQRILIALAMAKQPSLLIADEPTTGLDVITQEAVMELVLEATRIKGMSTLLITHDLGLAARYCQKIIVMHAGHIVEVAPTQELFNQAKHPYTAKLILSTPGKIDNLSRLEPIGGQLPDLRKPLEVCRYRERCEKFTPECDQAPLPFQSIDSHHHVYCRNPL